MSDAPKPGLKPGPNKPDPAPMRRASVSFRGDAPAQNDAAALMDPANRSLAEALKISFRIVQAAMVVLALLFVASGFQTVEEDEEGISVLLGKKRRADLKPGFHFAAPYPLGELVKVKTGVVDFVVAAYFPDAENKRQDPVQTIQTGSFGTLNPARNGSVLTGDLNLAHIWLTGRYLRTQPGQVSEFVHPDFEQAIIEAFVQRGAIHTVAQLGIDELLKGEAGDIQRRIQESAQTGLASVAGTAGGAGVTVDRIDINHRVPPLTLQSQFNAVSAARAQGRNAVEKARSEGDTLRNAAAGLAWKALLTDIREFELAIDAGNPADANRVLARIDAIMQGDDTPSGAVISGEVAEMLSDAENRRFAIASRAEGERSLFEAKLRQFESNPSLMISRDWSLALETFLSRPFVQSLVLPAGQHPELVINEDPDILRQLEIQRNQAEGRQALEDRELERRRDRFRVDQGIIRDEE